jgi:hypothetical protein
MAVNYFWRAVNGLLIELGLIIPVSARNMKLPSPTTQAQLESHDAAVAGVMESAARIVGYSQKYLAELKCDHIDLATKRLERFQKAKFSWAEANTRARALKDAVETELSNYLYYRYPRHLAEKFKTWKADWKVSVAAFPAIEREVWNATDCYAMGHPTASVFHSMRVAEFGLRALAKERKITLPRNRPIEWATWQDLIRALDAEIAAIGNKKAGAARDAALEFYSGARADLNGFKDEYRNLVMHVRATYDEHQALRALSNVNAFMNRIAVKIDHKHHRIRWGLR